MNYEAIILEKSEGIATITLNRPEKLNALNNKMAEELPQAFDEVATDDSINVVVITGAGRAFCAGADVQERFLGTIEKMKRGEINLALEPTFPDIALPALRRIEKPVIASVNGPATGFGSTLTLACDIRIASENARFVAAWIRRALMPDLGASYMLPRTVGLSKACELIFTGDAIDAKEAERIGLVSNVVPHEQLMSTTMELARRLAKGPPIAIQLAKRAIYEAQHMDMEATVEFERLGFAMTMRSEDASEGTRAFLEKREAIFKGR